MTTTTKAKSNGGGLVAIKAVAEFAQMLEAADDSNSNIEFKERMAEVELALEDMGWVRLGYETQAQLSRSALPKLILITRKLYLTHPLINHAVEVICDYVWGQGVSVVAKPTQIN